MQVRLFIVVHILARRTNMPSCTSLGLKNSA